jgi:hypothetical protein
MVLNQRGAHRNHHCKRQFWTVQMWGGREVPLQGHPNSTPD